MFFFVSTDQGKINKTISKTAKEKQRPEMVPRVRVVLRKYPRISCEMTDDFDR